MPERVLGESPMPALLTDEGCLGASTGDGSSSGAMPIPPASSLAASVVAFPLCKEREGRLGASEDGWPAEDGSSPGAALLKDSELTIPVRSQTTSVVPYSLGRVREDPVPALVLEEALAESVWNSAPAMGFLRRGFFGLRSPYSVSSSLDCKVAPIEDKGTLAPVNGMIRWVFLGRALLLPRFRWWLRFALLLRRLPSLCNWCILGG